MRSTGTESTKYLDGAQICSIIEACSRHGVTLLKFGDLQLELGMQAQPAGPSEPPPSTPQPPDAKISELQRTEMEKELEAETVRLRGMELDEKVLTDPLEFERQLLEGDLEDADDEYGDDE